MNPSTRSPRPSLAHILRNVKDAESWKKPRLNDQLGPYTLISPLGEGAFGEVWLANNTSSDTQAAVKIFRPGRFPEGLNESATRFHDGAAAMTKLQPSPHVVRIYEGANYSNGQLWFAMEYFPQRDFAQFRSRRKLNFAQASGLIEHLLEAVRAAHLHEPEQILHRDIRPQNLLVRSEGKDPEGVLADFDIAYYEDQLRVRDETGAILSNYRYLPPEVLKSGDPAKVMRRPENDLYAAAVCILEILTEMDVDISAQPNHLVSLLEQKGAGTTISSRHRRRIAGFLSQALSDDPSTRFSDVSEFISAWKLTSRETVSIEALLIFPVLSGVVAASCAADWAWFTCRDQFWWRLVALLSTAAWIAIQTVFSLSWILSMFSARLSAIRQRVYRWVRHHRITIATSILIVLASGPATLWASNFFGRSQLFALDNPEPCIAIGHDGFATDSFPPGIHNTLDANGTSRLICVKYNGSSPEITGHSLATVLPKLTLSESPAFRTSKITPTGPVSLRTSVAGFLENTTLDGLKTPRGPFPFQWGFDNAEGRTLIDALSAGGQLNCAKGCKAVSVRVDGRDISIPLLQMGLVELDSMEQASAEQRKTQDSAKAMRLGIWGERERAARAESRARLLESCPEECCHGIPCEEHQGCTEQTRCMLCRDGDAGRWKLKLLALNRLDGWSHTKVCVSSQSCTQTCVDVDDAGTPLGIVGCRLKRSEFAHISLEVLGKLDNSTEQRIAEQRESFSLPTAESACQTIVFRNLERRKATIPSVAFEITYDPPDRHQTLVHKKVSQE